MTEPKRIASLDDLAAGTKDYTITNPEDGAEFVFKMRELTADETAAIRKNIKQPAPPQDKKRPFEKDQYGRPYVVYDEKDPQYLYERELAANELVYEWLLECWEVEIKGETREEKVAALRSKLPMWAMLELSKKMQEINGIARSEVVLKKMILREKQQG